jgi:multidrug efflux pump subunit AcrB
MAAIPLAIAGALWGLLLFDKPMCKPAMMGMIFLGGTIVNNSILLLDFIRRARKAGMDKDEAILQSIQLRIRPILMTTGSTVIGLLPLVFEMAVGLERMSPIGVVATMGLLVGTFLTMIVIPTVYSSVDSLSALLGRTWLSILGSRREESQ